MELRQLRTFEAVVREGSVTDAAAVLGLAPSSVSQSVRTLEQSLGVALFVRGPRGMRVTAAGQRLLGWAGRLREQAEQARREVVAAAAEDAAAVRLGALESIAAAIVPEVLGRLAARRPGLRVDVTAQADRGALLAAVAAGELDAVLLLDAGDALGGLGFPVAPQEPLDFVDLEPVPLVLAAAPGHPRGGAGELRPEDLKGERLLVNGASACSFALAAERLFGPGVERVPAGSVAVMRAWVKAGLGIALLPHFAVAEDLAAGTVQGLPVRTPVLRLRLVWLRARGGLPGTRALLYAAAA